MNLAKKIGDSGLDDNQVLESRLKYGENVIQANSQNQFVVLFKDLLTDPMIIILIVASLIYFINGHLSDALFLLIAIFLVASISIFQNSKTHDALGKLSNLSLSKAKVIRNNELVFIDASKIVVDDVLIIDEGDKIQADGVIFYGNDFSVNESILTGESFSVYKGPNTNNTQVYSGTTVNSGLAAIRVNKVGNDTEMGKIGLSIMEIVKEATPLEIQINAVVRKMIYLGFVAFVIVWALNYLKNDDVLNSLQLALTFAMSIIPEEIPVAFTSFMALGAWRLLDKGILVKDMKTVESLGAATVLCLDKTGTITQNKMEIIDLYSFKNDSHFDLNFRLNKHELELIEMAMWSSEPIPFDGMEKSIHKAYNDYFEIDRRSEFELIDEYPLSGVPPMMTHIFENGLSKERIIASKGAPEAYLDVSGLDKDQKAKIIRELDIMTNKGLRILAVARVRDTSSKLKEKQQDYLFEFLGLVGFYDPPKKNISKVFNSIYEAGIKLKIITGDNAQTTLTISEMSGLKNPKHISGEGVDIEDNIELQKIVDSTNVYYRMFPQAKLKVINALKSNKEIVAMTGDGVNDGPALKAAHIGIAMGKKGTEIAKESASIILSDDNLDSILEALEMGRKIYSNLKKALQYIISIHIPIILTVALPLILNWKFPNIFTPVHVIVLELIMGPTCSIIYENEPIEKNLMKQAPRKLDSGFFSKNEILTSVVQGLMITIGVLLIYQFAVINGQNEDYTRTMTFTCLLSSNIFLTLVNRSFYFSIFETLRYKNILIPLIIGLTLVLGVVFLYVPMVRSFFDFSPIELSDLALSILSGFVFVIWYEFVKLYKRINPAYDNQNL